MLSLTDYARIEAENGIDSRFMEVRVGPRKSANGEDDWFKFRLKRIDAGAAFIQGVPALISALPQSLEGTDTKGRGPKQGRPMSATQARNLTHQFHGMICASVCGDWNEETQSWDDITFDPVRHDPANNIIALNWFTTPELMQIVNAIVTLQTGKEVGVMLDTLFQGAKAVFQAFTSGTLDALRSLDDANTVEPREVGGKRGGDTDGVEAGTETVA